MKLLVNKYIEEKQYEEAIKLLVDMDDQESKLILAELYNITNQPQLAYDLLINEAQNDNVVRQLLHACYSLAKFDELKTLFEKIGSYEVDDYAVLFQANYALGLHQDNLLVLAKAMEFQVKQASLNYFYYVTYSNLKEFELAYQHAKKAYELENNIFTLKNYMSACLVVDKYEECLAIYHQEEDADLKWLHFVALTQSKKHEEAIKFGEQLLIDYPQLILVADGLVHNYMNLENYAKAYQYAQYYEDSEDLQLKLRNLDVMRICCEKLNDEEGLKNVLAKLALYSDEHIPVYKEVETLFEKGEYATILEKLANIDTPTAMRQKTVAAYQLGDYQETVKLAKRALEADNLIDISKILILSALNINDITTAKTELLKLESNEQDLEFVFSNLARVYVQEQNFDEAIHYAFQAKELAPMNFESYARLAEIYSIAEKEHDAINTLIESQGYTDNPTHVEWINRNLGIMYYRTNQFDKAYEIFKNTNCLDESALWVTYHVAVVCMSLAKFDEAITYLEFLKAQPDYSAEIVYRLALCYIETKQNNKFQAVYDECEQLAIDNPENANYLEIVNNRAFRSE